MMRATYGGDVVGIGHSGDTDGGYHAVVFHFPEQQITIAGAVNTVDDSRVTAIAEAAAELVGKRDAWLNPPGASEAELKKRTLTNLYNAKPTWSRSTLKGLMGNHHVVRLLRTRSIMTVPVNAREHGHSDPVSLAAAPGDRYT